eukprot:COSAG02_NODE_32569_length_514_cov_0.980723_1_plen_50_part_01
MHGSISLFKLKPGPVAFIPSRMVALHQLSLLSSRRDVCFKVGQVGHVKDD